MPRFFKFKLNLKLNIRNRLVLGFMMVSLVLVAAVGTTVVQVNSVQGTTERIVALRVPTAAASSGMINNINASLAALRGWMLTGNPSFKTGRAAVWADIDKVKAEIDRLSASWTNPDNIKKWNSFKTTLAEFRSAQKQVEGIANSADEQPATKMLLTEAAPRAAILVGNITAMIDAELALEATPERKNLLGIMADVRGTTGLALANIRAYLLSGDAKFKEGFAKLWAKNVKRFADLQKNVRLLTPAQRAAFEEFSKARAEFAPLPPKMFEIRGSKKWNMANWTLVTEAAPRAGKLLTILAGAKAADGSRAGGMVDNQKALLNADANGSAEAIGQLKIIEWFLLGIGLLAAIVVTFFTSRSIVNPVGAMTGAMSRLAEGDKSVEVPAQERTDEIGEMAKAVQVFKENAAESERLASERAKEEAEKVARGEKVARLTQQFEESSTAILEMVSAAGEQMQSSATTLTSIAEETSRQSTAVASAGEEASSNVQTVASAAEEMSSSIDEIGRQVTKSTEITTRAVDEADKTNTTVEGLAEAADKIGKVVELINDIANQTNLLALNATIEAARAGDAGKGFAVVASEVKNLANQTGKATEEISAQINTMQAATSGAVEAIKGIGQTIGEVSEIAGSIASSVEEQGAATQEIARNVQEAAKGTQEVSSNIAGVNKAADETGNSASQVLDASRNLSEQSENLRQEVEKFLAEVRAA